jgi:hypothetical protein
MLSLSDSRNLARTLAAIGLVVGPLLLFLSVVLDPAWSDDSAQYLQEVADSKGRYILVGALWTVGTLLFIAGTLGLVRLMRGPGLTLGQVGATLLTIGLIGMAAGLAFNALDVTMAELDNRDAAAALSDQLEDSVPLNVYWLGFFVGGIVLGSVLLAVALVRRRIVPIWAPILLVVALVLGFVGGESRIGSALTFLLLAAALVPLAMLIWSLSDEAWGRWIPIEDERREADPRGDAGASATAMPADDRTDGAPVAGAGRIDER